jgi:catechol 2,3-dioxygenase-like lactoylglutathione lyase family enzyme
VFDHLDIAVSDLAASRRFYTLALGEPDAVHEWIEWGEFGITPVSADHPLTQHLHVAFGLASRAAVDHWWLQMIEAGYRSDGEPGPRPQYHPDYYGGFLLDPEGNSVEAVYGVHPPGGANRIDHLWIRVEDLEVSRRFWQTVAPPLGLELHETNVEGRLFAVASHDRHFILVEDERPRTEHVHLAFPVEDDAAVEEFHRVALAAGYRDNGGPGERPQYHPGYFGAFVLDPDGHNVEAVNHNR